METANRIVIADDYIVINVLIEYIDLYGIKNGRGNIPISLIVRFFNIKSHFVAKKEFQRDRSTFLKNLKMDRLQIQRCQ